MSRQDALTACQRADLLTLTTTLSDSSFVADDQLVFDLLSTAILNKATGIVRWLLSTYHTAKLNPRIFFDLADSGDVETFDLIYAKYPSLLTDRLESHMRGSFLGLALSAGRPKAFIEHLLALGSNPNGLEHHLSGTTPLALAASSYESSEVVELLLQQGARMKGSRALASAGVHGRKANVQYLLEHGADVNDPGNGCSPYLPLHAAVRKGDKDIVRILLAGPQQANWGLVDGDGKTAVELAQEVGDTDILALMEAAMKGRDSQ